MPKIRIKRIPEGGAPEHVRQCWVGVALSAKGPVRRGVSQYGKPWSFESRTVYVVETSHALTALKERDWMAAAWFMQHPQTGRFMYFISEDCEEIDLMVTGAAGDSRNDSDTVSIHDFETPSFESALQDCRERLAPMRKAARDADRLTGEDYNVRIGPVSK